MKQIHLPIINWSGVVGKDAVVVVKVDWPELKLTEQQVVENAVAVAAGEDPPHLDPSFIEVHIPWPVMDYVSD